MSTGMNRTATRDAREDAREDAISALRHDALTSARHICRYGPNARIVASALLIDAIVGLTGPGEISRALLFIKESLTNWDCDDEIEVDAWLEIENLAHEMGTEAEERLRYERRNRKPVK